MVRFMVVFEGEKKPRNFMIRPSNCATFAVDHDAVVLEPWLVRQGFALTQQKQKEGEHNGKWQLE